MWQFIFEIMVFAGLAGGIALALRALPRVSNEVFAESRSRMRTHELMLFLERADDVLKAHFEKFLRKMKIVILKADNAVTEKIAKVTDTRTKEKTSFVVPQAEPEKPPKPAITEEGLPVRPARPFRSGTGGSQTEEGNPPEDDLRRAKKAKPEFHDDSSDVTLVSLSGQDGMGEAPMEIHSAPKKKPSRRKKTLI